MKRQTRSSRLKDVPGIGVDRVGNAADAARNPDILRLENLDTDILPPAVALEATRAAISVDANNSYLPFFGHDALRQAVARHVSRLSGIEYDWRSQVIISAGGLSGILISLLALIEPGDEVIVTDPIYAGLINRIRIAGGVVRFVPLRASSDGWRLDIAALYAACSPRTCMVLIMSPSMPTGHVLTQNEWNAVADVCNATDAWLLYDAAMERILFDERARIHPAGLSGMTDRTIIVGSASKELRMIGWRVGWIVGPQKIMHDIGLVSLSNVVCQVGIGMPGVTAALTAADDGLSNAVAVWERRRDLVLRELEGLPVIPPHGGWSLLLNTQKLGISPHEASHRLLTEADIAATPMVGWGETARDYIRFVFSNEPEERLRGIGSTIRRVLCVK